MSYDLFTSHPAHWPTAYISHYTYFSVIKHVKLFIVRFWISYSIWIYNSIFCLYWLTFLKIFFPLKCQVFCQRWKHGAAWKLLFCMVIFYLCKNLQNLLKLGEKGKVFFRNSQVTYLWYWNLGYLWLHLKVFIII